MKAFMVRTQESNALLGVTELTRERIRSQIKLNVSPLIRATSASRPLAEKMVSP